jgi:hypothetical protein
MDSTVENCLYLKVATGEGPVDLNAKRVTEADTMIAANKMNTDCFFMNRRIKFDSN